MKITKVIRFDDIIKDGESVISEYHGYELRFDTGVTVKVYDESGEAFVEIAVTNDTPISDLMDIECHLWSLGYSDIKFLDSDGFKSLLDIRQNRMLPKVVMVNRNALVQYVRNVVLVYTR